MAHHLGLSYPRSATNEFLQWFATVGAVLVALGRRSDGFTYLGGFALPIDIFMSEGDQEVNVPPIKALVEILVGGEN